MTAAAVLAPGRSPFVVGKPTKSMENTHFHVHFGHLIRRCVDGNGSAALFDLLGSASAVLWMFGAKGGAGWDVAGDEIARGEAYGDDAYRPG